MPRWARPGPLNERSHDHFSERRVQYDEVCHVSLAGGVCAFRASCSGATFEATGTFEDGSSLSGTVTIDMTTGLATAVDLTVATEYSALFFDSSAEGGTLTTIFYYGPTFSATTGFYTPPNFAQIEYVTADGSGIILGVPASGLNLPATALPIIPEFDAYYGPPDYTSFYEEESGFSPPNQPETGLIDGLLQPISTVTIPIRRFRLPPPRLTF